MPIDDGADEKREKPLDSEMVTQIQCSSPVVEKAEKHNQPHYEIGVDNVIPVMKAENRFSDTSFLKPDNGIISDPDRLPDEIRPQIPDLTRKLDSKNEEMDNFNDFRKQYGYVSSPDKSQLEEICEKRHFKHSDK